MRTTAMRFVDTNVLLYAISTVPAEAPKALRARVLLRERDLALSVQVLQEFYVQATRAHARHTISHAQAVVLMAAWQRFPVQDITVSVMSAALVARDRWGLSYWDAAILAVAKRMGCHTVFSEDLNDGQNYNGVTVVNPFKGATP